jgi:hypothetical protein
MALARDATSSGDQVMAENYLQHAEHYNRIIMAAQAQFQEQMGQRPRPEFEGQGGESSAGEGGYDGEEEGLDEQPFAGEAQPRQAEFRPNDMPRGYEPQPMLPRHPNIEQRNDGRPFEGRQGGEGRFGGDGRQSGGYQGEGRNQQGDYRGRRNRHRHDNRYRQQQGGGMPANPADIAAMAAANGSGFQDSERRRDRPDDRGPAPEPAQDE